MKTKGKSQKSKGSRMTFNHEGHEEHEVSRSVWRLFPHSQPSCPGAGEGASCSGFRNDSGIAYVCYVLPPRTCVGRFKSWLCSDVWATEHVLPLARVQWARGLGGEGINHYLIHDTVVKNLPLKR